MNENPDCLSKEECIEFLDYLFSNVDGGVQSSIEWKLQILKEYIIYAFDFN